MRDTGYATKMTSSAKQVDNRIGLAQMRFKVTGADKLGAILHIVNDYSNLVSSGTLIQQDQMPPIKTHVQYSFLVECRKFAAFFGNKRGPKGADIASKDYLKAKLRFNLPVWKAWHDHMNVHLMHLSYDRLSSITQWTGHTVNADLLAEFQKAWKLFLAKIEDPYKSEFEIQIEARSRKPEFKGLDFR